MVLAAGGLPAAPAAVAGGAVLLLTAAGSAMLNSVLDYPLDCRMPRLTARIRALETLGRKKTILLATTLIVAGVSVSVAFLNFLVTLLTLAAVFGYLVPYTLRLKRTSPFGTIPGSIPGALPVLIGYAAIKPLIGPDGLILFLLAAPPLLDTCAPLPGRLPGSRTAGASGNFGQALYENLHPALCDCAAAAVSLTLVFRLLFGGICRTCVPYRGDLSCHSHPRAFLQVQLYPGIPCNQRLSDTASASDRGGYLSASPGTLGKNSPFSFFRRERYGISISIKLVSHLKFPDAPN